MEEKKKLVAELYTTVQKQTEVIPNDVTEFFLRRSGFECEDPVVIKMVSFAAQKFLSDLAKESYALSKKRQQVAPSGSQQQQKASRRNVMLLEDVASAAAKYGIRVSKPEYFADSLNAGLAMEQAPAAAEKPEKRGAAASAANPPARKKKKN